MKGISTILLDVDDTLYPKGTGPFAQVNSRIDSYVMSVCMVDLDSARRLRKTYIETYGSTLQGLMRFYGIDPGHYLKDVHDVPVEELLRPDERLRETLGTLPCRLVAFTNGSYDYAGRILAALKVDDLVRDLFTIEYMDFIPKPLPWAFHKVMGQYGGVPQDYLVVDDSTANVRTAVELGMAAVHVGPSDSGGFCLNVPDIYGIPHVVVHGFS
jgi:putative hydrolase of the HAD superfamily